MCQLHVSTQRISELHQARATTIGSQQLRTRQQDHHSLGSGRSNVQSVEAVEKLHSTRSILFGRCGQRVNDDRGLLPLEFVDCADSYAHGQALREIGHLYIVWRNDQNVLDTALVQTCV